MGVKFLWTKKETGSRVAGTKRLQEEREIVFDEHKIDTRERRGKEYDG